MTDETTDDKELETLLDSEVEDDSTTSSTEENPDESDDSTGEEDEINKSKTVALKRERQLRKDSQQKVKDLEAEIEQSKTKDTPAGKKTSLRKDFLEMRAKTDLMELQLDDPTFRERASEVKKILFNDMPELLEKKNGLKIADDIAKGRLITSSEDNEKKDMQNNQTTPAQAKRKEVKKNVSQKDYNNMSSDERDAYEESEILKQAEKFKK